MLEIPEKPAYKSSEVCQYTDTQPYVLHFWASEFPQLNPGKSRGGQPVYTRDDIELVLRIKKLLYEDEYTIADARRLLDDRADEPSVAPAAPAPGAEAETAAMEGTRVATLADEPVRLPEAHLHQEALAFGAVPRDRYDDAVDEITHLRLKLKEAETMLRRNEHALERADASNRQLEERRARALARLEQLLTRLGSSAESG